MTIPPEPVRLDVNQPLWERFFTLAPLVLVGTEDGEGHADLAPKHMVLPLGWDNYFGFVCTPRHQTWANIEETREFTVSFPRPDQLLFTSLAASPRCDDDSKPVLEALETFPGPVTGVSMMTNAWLWLECELERIVDGFGDNGLIAGRIVAAHAMADALRVSDVEDETVLAKAPLLAYVHPGRFTVIDEARSFPFPAGMKK